MRTAVLSDIHGNLEALEEVLRDIDRSGVDRTYSLGDNIGYGPEPEGVIRKLLERGIPSILGNHELGLIDASLACWFNPATRQSLGITRRLLSPESMGVIRAYPRTLRIGETLLVHGCPPESVTTYLFEVTDEEMHALFLGMHEQQCFVGHTHELELISFDGRTVDAYPLGPDAFPLDHACRHIINAGSVGQPRDGNNNAKYVIWDDEARALEVRFIPYDIEKTVKRILERGFPSLNAERLR